MSAVRVAVIGIGRMGDLFCQLLMQESASTLVAVADLDPRRCDAAAEAYGVAGYYDFHDLLGRDDVDAVVIAVSDQFHLEPAVAAARAGKHIFIEKPVATIVDEAREIVHVAEANDVTLMVAHVLRFDPRFLIARDAISSGDLGPLAHLYARYDCGISSARYIGGRTSLSMFIGVHAIDIIHFLTSSRFVEVTARSVRGVLSDLDVDDSVISLFELENGAIGTLETSWIRPAGPTDRIRSVFEVVGAAGRLQVEQGAPGVSIYHGTEVAQVEYPDGILMRRPVMYEKISGAYRDELLHFVDCVITGRRPVVTGEEGLAAVIVADAVERSLAKGGERVTIEW